MSHVERKKSHLQHLIAPYHDLELGPRRAKRVELHLADCAECRAKLAEMDRLAGVLAEDKLPDAFSSAETFRSRVLLCLHRRQPRQSDPLFWAWFFVPASLVLVLFAVQVLWFALGSVGMVSRIAQWSGVEMSALSARLPDAVSTASPALEFVFGSPLRDVMQIGGFMFIYLLLLVVFVLYAGWVGVLTRSVQRVTVSEGDRDGSL